MSSRCFNFIVVEARVLHCVTQCNTLADFIIFLRNHNFNITLNKYCSQQSAGRILACATYHVSQGNDDILEKTLTSARSRQTRNIEEIPLKNESLREHSFRNQFPNEKETFRKAPLLSYHIAMWLVSLRSIS